MLAEFDPYKWDVWIFVFGVAGMIWWYFWRRKKLIEEIRAKISFYSTALPNVTVTFWKGCEYDKPPSQAELDLIAKVFTSAELAWPDLSKQLHDIKYNVWFIHAPTQPVGWRQYGGIAWNAIPPLTGIAETTPGMGFGGMSERGSTTGTMYVATFFDGRSPRDLLAHELTHCAPPIRGHAEPFSSYEQKLLAQLNGI